MLELLAPSFLAGLLALAVPVLIHLLHRERRQAVAFPSLVFLRRVPFRSVRRQKLRHLLLFCARCGAIALVALAFARPFRAAPPTAAAAGGGARLRVLLVDRSYSMGLGDRFERARAAALAALGELSPADDAGLILFDESAEGVVPPTREHARVRAALAAASVSAGGTRFAPALRLAQDWLAASETPSREALLLSDCQRRGIEGLEELRFPPGAGLRVASLAEPAADNAAVTSVAFDREIAQGRERVAATARVVSRGGRAQARRVSLEIGGRVVEEKPVALEANGAASVTFAAFAYPEGAQRGRVRLDRDALEADDALSFVLSPGQDVAVLLVEPGGAAPYLRRALAIGVRPRFRVRAVAALAAGDLESAAAVVFAGRPPDEAAGAALAGFVERGGGVIASLLGAAPWRGAAAELLPVRPQRVVDRTADRGATLASLDLDHPALDLFKAPRSGDFTAARFLRYQALEPAEGARVLARFDDGGVALAEREHGKGRVLALASGLDALTSDLPLQPVFLPLVHRLVLHAVGHRETRPFRTVGEVLDLGATPEGEPVSILTPSGRRLRPGKGRLGVELSEAGFYEVARGAAPAEPLAVNSDTAESDPAAIDPEELSGMVLRGGAARPGTRGPDAPEDAERRQALWWYLLAAAFLLVAAEARLANRITAGVA